MHRRFLALGGGGATHGLDRQIDDFTWQQLAGASPRVGYLGWATEQADQRLTQLREQWAGRCRGIESLAPGATAEQARRWVAGCDLIYVSGGDARWLLGALRAAGLDGLLAQAMDHGLVLVGVSAGAAVWFECAWSDSGGRGLARLDGLGLFRGSFCPHYDSEPQRRPSLEAAVRLGVMPDGLAVDDGVAVLVTQAGPQALCSARPGATAWWVDERGSRCLQPP